MPAHSLYVSKSTRVQDIDSAAFKLGEIRVDRAPSIVNTELLAKFESDVKWAQGKKKTVLFPLGLDPLTVSITTFYQFLAVHDKNQLYIEYYSMFNKFVVRFIQDGPYIAKEDVISIVWNDSMWPQGIDADTRFCISESYLLMGKIPVEYRATNTKDQDENFWECEYRQKEIWQKRHNKEMRVTERFGNKTVTTIERQSISQTNHKYVRYLINKRRRKCESLSKRWNSLLTTHTATRGQKRKWTQALYQPKTCISSNSAKQKEQKKLAALQDELADLQCAVLSVQCEKEQKELSNLATAIQYFLEDAHNLNPTSATDKLLLATTTPGCTIDKDKSRILSSDGAIVPLHHDWKNHLNPSDLETLNQGVQHKFPKHEQFISMDSELALTTGELQMKEDCVRAQVYKVAQNVKRQIRCAKNKIATFPAEEEWEKLCRSYQRSKKLKPV